MRLWKITDEEFIARVRCWQRVRRWAGVAMIIIGLAGCAPIVYWTCDHLAKSEALMKELQRDSVPTTQQLNQEMNDVNFDFGFSYGAAIVIGIYSFGGMAATGIACLIGKSRRDTLLLKCWDDLPAGRSST